MIMNTMELDGYTAVITYDADKDWFRGVIQGLNGSADFHGRTPEELRHEFRASLDFFIELCERDGRLVKKTGKRQVCCQAPARTAPASSNRCGRQWYQHELPC